LLDHDNVEFSIGDTNIILRQTRIEDLEKEFPAFTTGHFLNTNVTNKYRNDRHSVISNLNHFLLTDFELAD